MHIRPLAFAALILAILAPTAAVPADGAATLKRYVSVRLSEQGVRAAKSTLPASLRVTGDLLVPVEGYALYAAGNIALVVDLHVGGYTTEDTEIEIEAFRVWSKDFDPRTGVLTIVYCSCGGATTAGSMDSCDVSDDPETGGPSCGGGCMTEDKCGFSITAVQLYGGSSVVQVGVGG